MLFLLLDDHPLFRNSMRGLLEYLYPDAQFLELDSVAETQAFICNQVPDFIVADLQLVDAMSFDLIRAIKSKHKQVPVLVVSMHEDSRMINQALDAGADGYVSKREDTPAVKQAIAHLLEGKKHLSETVTAIVLKSLQTPKQSYETDYAALFSEQEYQVFKMLGSEMSRKEIADKLDVSIPTINTYINRMKKKMKLNSTLKLVYHAIKACNAEI